MGSGFLGFCIRLLEACPPEPGPVVQRASPPPAGDAVCAENPDQAQLGALVARAAKRDITSERFRLVKRSGVEAPLYSNCSWYRPRMAAGKRWTRAELMLALNLYHKLTFGQMHHRQPAIVALAGKMGRGASSLAMKLCNFASLDPALKMRGIKGLSGASALDRSVWSEFHESLAEAAPASEAAFRQLFGAVESKDIEVTPKEGVRIRTAPVGPTEAKVTV